MSGQTAAAVIVAIAALIGAYVALRKRGPETNDIRVTTADTVNEMTLRFAGVVDKDNDDLRADLANLRREFDQYREDCNSRMSELSTRLRAATAENVRLEGENGRLRGRVDELEAEVARLKADR